MNTPNTGSSWDPIDNRENATRYEMAPGTKLEIEIPSRWAVPNLQAPQAEVLREIDAQCETLARGVGALQGLYKRITDTIRAHGLTDDQVRPILVKHFVGPRVSELLRVCRAPDQVYARYSAGFVGFKATVQQCRLYHITPGAELQLRKIRRTADHLIKLMKSQNLMELKILGYSITIRNDCVVELPKDAAVSA